MGKRKMVAIILLLIMCLSLTGCVKGFLRYDINEDYSVDSTIRLMIDSSALGLMSFDGDPLEEVKDGLQKEGYTVKVIKEENMTGFEGEKHFDDIDDLPTPENLMKSDIASSGNDSQLYKIEKGLFKNTFTVKQVLDLTYEKQNDIGLSSLFLQNIDFKLVLGLPVEPSENNASRVVEEGKTLEWDLILGSNNEIFLKVEVLNILNMIIAACGLAVLIGLIIIFLIKRKKTNRVV